LQKFQAYTKASMVAARNMSPQNRTFWSPACPFHCYSKLGDMSDPDSNKLLSPVGSQNTLGLSSKAFIRQGVREDMFDTVEWPNNKLCSHNGTASCMENTFKK
jgi:hypothetical protein